MKPIFNPDLVILAAGMGSRYGGLKQIDGIGPQGETILEYSVYDAIKAGFGRVVFIVRDSFRRDFEVQIANRFKDKIEVVCVSQELDLLPLRHKPPANRVKPWGTGHALYVAKNAIQNPFAVLNADDFYGRETLSILSQSLRQLLGKSPVEGILAAYALGETLSSHGTVSRGICSMDEKGFLSRIEEHTGLKFSKERQGIVSHQSPSFVFSPETPVSMNAMGFSCSFLDSLEEDLIRFLENSQSLESDEFYLPAAVSNEMNRGRARIQVEISGGSWLGVTYPEDRAMVKAQLTQFHESGVYPPALWS